MTQLLTVHITFELPDSMQLPNGNVLVNKVVNNKTNIGKKKHTFTRKKWTKKDDNFLIGHHSKMSYEEMAKELGRKKTQIAQKIYALRNKGKIPRNPKWKHKTPHKTEVGRLRRKNDDNGNGTHKGLTCYDCPKATRELFGETIFCMVDHIRKSNDTPMCKDMLEAIRRGTEKVVQ